MTEPKEPLVIQIGYGTQLSGQWCDNCLLPSRSTVPIHSLTADGLNEIGEFSDCKECGREDDQ